MPSGCATAFATLVAAPVLASPLLNADNSAVFKYPVTASQNDKTTWRVSIETVQNSRAVVAPAIMNRSAKITEVTTEKETNSRTGRAAS